MIGGWSIFVTFRAISGNGKRFEPGGREKVSCGSVGTSRLSARATDERRVRAKARQFLVAA
jgi:hypothetical protein